jgi:two-component system sensor histidine kinase DegS
VIEDDGRGFDVQRIVTNPKHRRLGLTGMRERAAQVAGTVEVESEQNKGTTVIVRIPLEAVPHETV